MKIPSLTLLTLDQIADASQADKALVSQLNTTQATLYSALQGRLTLTDNITSQIATVSFTTASNYQSSNNFTMLTFDRKLPTIAKILILSKCVNNNAPYAPQTGVITCTNWQDVNGQIQIYFVTGLNNSTPYTLTFLLF